MKLETPPEALLDLPPYFDAACGDGLVWLDSCGIGVCRKKPEASLYGPEYFAEFKRRDASQMGALLTSRRVNFVCRHVHSAERNGLVDIGIGGGRFVSEMGCWGYDVNPEAIAWLKDEDLWADVRTEPAVAMTFWDSLEHALDWSQILSNCRGWAFVSTPIYSGKTDVTCSKHFKPTGEHQLYFTRRGLKSFMHWHGFRLVEEDNFESELGRDGIGTFAFFRRRF